MNFTLKWFSVAMVLLQFGVGAEAKGGSECRTDAIDALKYLWFLMVIPFVIGSSMKYQCHNKNDSLSLS